MHHNHTMISIVTITTIITISNTNPPTAIPAKAPIEAGVDNPKTEKPGATAVHSKSLGQRAV